MTRTIWVVMGSTGEYSDRSEWLVVAYEDEVAAKRHADAATEACLRVSKGKCEHDEKWREACDDCHRHYGDDALLRSMVGDLDPKVTMDYTGTDYVALPVPLLSASPEVKPTGEEAPRPAEDACPECEGSGVHRCNEADCNGRECSICGGSGRKGAP